jgi:hypothetical protein
MKSDTTSKAIICDLDGTLCDHRHRLHHIADSRKKDYDAFYAAMDKDTPNKWCEAIICSLYDGQWGEVIILYVTGRPNKYRNITEIWLSENNIVKFGGKSGQDEQHSLFMRPDYLYPWNGQVDMWNSPFMAHPERKPDHRPAYEVKREIYEQKIKNKYEVLFCLEDDPECVKIYRDLGLICLDVGRTQ